MGRGFTAVDLPPGPRLSEPPAVLVRSLGARPQLPQVPGGVSPGHLVLVTSVTACAHRRLEVSMWAVRGAPHPRRPSPGPVTRAARGGRERVVGQDPAGHQKAPQHSAHRWLRYLLLVLLGFRPGSAPRLVCLHLGSRLSQSVGCDPSQRTGADGLGGATVVPGAVGDTGGDFWP